MKTSRAKLILTATPYLYLFLLILSAGSSVSALSQAKTDVIHKRAEALQTLLELSSTQTETIEAILLRTSERGEAHRNVYEDDYYGLALENQREMDSMRAQVDAALTEEQRKKYQALQQTAQVRYSSRDGEELARRLLLDSAQARLVDAILSYAEQDIKRIRREAARKGRGFGRGFSAASSRSAMMRRRAKMLKAHEAIEKVLSKAQKKEFREYKRERMDQFRPAGNDNRRGGFDGL